jgi:aminobenzoyl-glutamate transport protein
MIAPHVALIPGIRRGSWKSIRRLTTRRIPSLTIPTSVAFPAIATEASAGTQLIQERNRFLDGVERLGNALPDPALIFLGLIAGLMAMSAIGAAAGWSALNPVTGETLIVKSLLSEPSLQLLLTEMPRTYAAFAPLGLVLTIMLGAGVADRSGLFAALVRASLSAAPTRVLVPTVMLIGMLTCHAGDAGYVVFVPLAGLIFAGVGRHPVLGLVVGFAGVGVGLSGNLLPGQHDVLLLGITETGARMIEPSWTMNPLGNWWFGLGIAGLFTGLGWMITEHIVAPRLGAWRGDDPVAGERLAAHLTTTERCGLRAAGLAALGVVALFAGLALWPGFTPLYDEAAAPGQRLTPLFRALAPAFLLLFVASGWAYGAVAGTVRSHRDVVTMMAKGLESMLPYVVLVFFAAQFVALFGWSNLGPITAIVGANQLRAMDAPPALLLPMLTTMSAWLDFLIASSSAKWTAMAPVAAPMMMLLGISPEMTTAAYRVGDTVTNLISPLNAYFVLTLTFCRRWIPDFSLGTLLALMLPLSIAFFLGGAVLTAFWVAFEIPVGLGAAVSYALSPVP